MAVTHTPNSRASHGVILTVRSGPNWASRSAPRRPASRDEKLCGDVGRVRARRSICDLSVHSQPPRIDERAKQGAESGREGEGLPESTPGGRAAPHALRTVDWIDPAGGVLWSQVRAPRNDVDRVMSFVEAGGSGPTRCRAQGVSPAVSILRVQYQVESSRRSFSGPKAVAGATRMRSPVALTLWRRLRCFRDQA